jgi:hypothetical protein
VHRQPHRPERRQREPALRLLPHPRATADRTGTHPAPEGQWKRSPAPPLFQQIDAGTPLTDLPWPAQVLVLVNSAQGILDNGGLQYFLESDWPANPPYSCFLDALEGDPVAGPPKQAGQVFPYVRALDDEQDGV